MPCGWSKLIAFGFILCESRSEWIRVIRKRLAKSKGEMKIRVIREIRVPLK